MLTGLTILGFVGTSALVIGLILLAILVFEVAMFISALTNPRISDEARIFWIIGMLLVHPFVAIAYYLTDFKKR